MKVIPPSDFQEAFLTTRSPLILQGANMRAQLYTYFGAARSWTRSVFCNCCKQKEEKPENTQEVCGQTTRNDT